MGANWELLRQVNSAKIALGELGGGEGGVIGEVPGVMDGGR